MKTETRSPRTRTTKTVSKATKTTKKTPTATAEKPIRKTRGLTAPTTRAKAQSIPTPASANDKPTKVMTIKTLKAGNVKSTVKEENAANYSAARILRDEWAKEYADAKLLKKAKFYVRFELPDSFVSIRIFRHRAPRPKKVKAVA